MFDIITRVVVTFVFVIVPGAFDGAAGFIAESAEPGVTVTVKEVDSSAAAPAAV